MTPPLDLSPFKTVDGYRVITRRVESDRARKARAKADSDARKRALAMFA